jgi:hypothetical protein
MCHIFRLLSPFLLLRPGESKAVLLVFRASSKQELPPKNSVDISTGKALVSLFLALSWLCCVVWIILGGSPVVPVPEILFL